MRLNSQSGNITSEQIKLFRSLFSGRDDVYGVMGQKGPLCIREPLTDELLVRHFSGGARIGQYALFKDSTIRWACIDIDEMVRDKAGRIVVGCIENNLFPYVERSRSKGYHIWLFFDEPVKAQSVRRVLSKVLKDVGAEGCEVFPKQDSITSDNGVGNFVFLPLQGNSVEEKMTVFLDSQFNPYEDQWGHLSKFHRTKSENILSLAQEITDEIKDEYQKPESPAEGSLDVAKYLIHYNIPFQEKKESTRKIFQLTKCPWADNHTGGDDGKGHAAIIQGSNGKITFYCFHKHCQGRTWADARQKISGNDLLIQFCEASQSRIDKGLFLLTPSTVNNLPPLEPLFDGYPLELRHLNVLVGAPGDLKTLTTYEYARSVLTGQALYGRYPCMKKGPVLIIDEDNPGDIIQERFRRFGFTSDDLPIFLSHMAGFLIDNPAWFEKLRATVLEIKPVLIIIDCFSLVHGKKENQSDEIMRVMKLFRKIANMGPCILFVHHLTKDKENPSTRGSGGIIGAVENEIWNVKKGEATILQFTKKTRQRPLDPIELSVTGFEDGTDKAPISIQYQGSEIQILLNHIIEVLRDESEPIVRASGIEEADTIEVRLRDKQVSFTEAKLKKALELGVKTKILMTGRATLMRADGKPFRATGYLLSPMRN